jgi:hypothetical protein
MLERRDQLGHIGCGLEALLLTWLGTRVSLTDDQVYAALTAMGAKEMQIVMLRCTGLTAEEVAAREGYGVTQVRLLTVAGLRRAVERLWPEGQGGGRDTEPRLYRELPLYAT